MTKRTWAAGLALIVTIGALVAAMTIARSSDTNPLPSKSVYHLQVSLEDLIELTTLVVLK